MRTTDQKEQAQSNAEVLKAVSVGFGRRFLNSSRSKRGYLYAFPSPLGGNGRGSATESWPTSILLVLLLIDPPNSRRPLEKGRVLRVRCATDVPLDLLLLILDSLY
jgi:hypothetical protein